MPISFKHSKKVQHGFYLFSHYSVFSLRTFPEFIKMCAGFISRDRYCPVRRRNPLFRPVTFPHVHWRNRHQWGQTRQNLWEDKIKLHLRLYNLFWHKFTRRIKRLCITIRRRKTVVIKWVFYPLFIDWNLIMRQWRIMLWSYDVSTVKGCVDMPWLLLFVGRSRVIHI